jgi:ATP-dependent Lon protease
MEGTPPKKPLDFEAALDALPLFPLPHVALMPGATLPLFVFEPRYKRMVRDALDSHRTIAVVQILDDGPVDAEGHPKIARIAGVGTIVDHTELPSGRYNIVLRGRSRVSLDELPFTPPYRRARARILPDHDENVSSTAMAALISTATAFAAIVRQRDDTFAFKMPKVSDAGSLADHCAAHLLIDGRDRQAVLETTSVADRVRLVTETLALQQLGLSATDGALN